MADTLLELAERCEAAEGPDRELDVAIADAMTAQAGWPEIFSDVCAPPFTASVDEAMTLVPEGWFVDELKEYNQRTWKASLRFDRMLTAGRQSPVSSRTDGNPHGTATAALALCAAALRAISHQEQKP